MQLSPRARELSRDAAQAQRSFFRLHRIQLGLIVVAAAIGVIPLDLGGAVNWAGVIAASLFGVSVLLRVLLMNFRDEERWYASRRGAELAKSLCFRYAYGAESFERELDDRTALRRLTEESSKLGEAVTRPAEDAPRTFAEASEEMTARRRLPLTEARAQYLSERIADQEAWFSDRADRNRRRARRYLFIMVAAEVLGMLFGILLAVRMAPEGLLGLMSAIAAAAIAWSQLRQHSLLATGFKGHGR